MCFFSLVGSPSPKATVRKSEKYILDFSAFAPVLIDPFFIVYAARAHLPRGAFAPSHVFHKLYIKPLGSL
jgi:hypothetical protein